MTIKEIAELLGTTKPLIQGQLIRNCPTSFYSKVNGVYDISDEGVQWFTNRIRQVNHAPNQLNQNDALLNHDAEQEKENTCKIDKSQVNHESNYDANYSESQVNHDTPDAIPVSALDEELRYNLIKELRYNLIKELRSQIDKLKVDNDKLTEDNAWLKEQLSDFQQLHQSEINQKNDEINQLMQQVSDLQRSNDELASATAKALLQSQSLQYIESAKVSEGEKLRDPADAPTQNSDIAQKNLAKKKSFSRFNPLNIMGIKHKR